MPNVVYMPKTKKLDPVSRFHRTPTCDGRIDTRPQLISRHHSVARLKTTEPITTQPTLHGSLYSSGTILVKFHCDHPNGNTVGKVKLTVFDQFRFL